MEYATSGSVLNNLGKINFINHGPKDTTIPFQFAEITLNLKNATIIYPNILVSEKNDIINVNNGHTSIEKIRHNLEDFPLFIKNNILVLKKPRKQFRIKECVYLTARANYSAFLLGEIPRIRKYLKLIQSGIPIVLHGECMKFHLEFFKILGFDSTKIIHVPRDTLVITSNLYHSTPTFFHHSVTFGAIDFIRKNVKTNIDYKFNSNIYLSRSKLGSNADRRITNEKTLEEFFRSKNFSIIHPEDLNILEQINIFRSAKILIAPFGATWANSIFRGQNTCSLMLSTKYTPEFSRIFQYLGADLSVLNLIPVKVREEKNISKSYNFNVGENEFEILTKYLKHINTDEI